MTAPIPAAAEKKFLLDFFTKKSRVQGSALPQPAQGRQRRRALTTHKIRFFDRGDVVE